MMISFHFIYLLYTINCTLSCPVITTGNTRLYNYNCLKLAFLNNSSGVKSFKTDDNRVVCGPGLWEASLLNINRFTIDVLSFRTMVINFFDKNIWFWAFLLISELVKTIIELSKYNQVGSQINANFM